MASSPVSDLLLFAKANEKRKKSVFPHNELCWHPCLRQTCERVHFRVPKIGNSARTTVPWNYFWTYFIACIYIWPFAMHSAFSHDFSPPLLAQLRGCSSQLRREVRLSFLHCNGFPVHDSEHEHLVCKLIDVSCFFSHVDIFAISIDKD